MKNILFFILSIVALAVVSCDNETGVDADYDVDIINNDTNRVISDFGDSSEIIGVWKADVSLIDGVEYKLADEISLSFGADKRFEFVCNDIMTSGTYHYSDSVAYCTKNEQIVITDGLQFKFSNYDSSRVRIDVSENVLIAVYKSTILAHRAGKSK